MSSFDSFYPILYTALTACGSSAAFVRAFQPSGTIPQPPRGTDVCYFDLAPARAPDPKYTTVDRSQSVKDLYTRTVPVNLNLYFYGPDAEDNALRIRTMLFSDAVKAMLRKNGIVPIPEPEEPVSLPEIEGTQWRKRCDLTVSLRILQTYTVAGSSITVAPELDINHN